MLVRVSTRLVLYLHFPPGGEVREAVVRAFENRTKSKILYVCKSKGETEKLAI